MPLASLPLLAALTPPGHSVTLLDENIEDIDFDRCARADIVGLTGMVVQRERMREILTELKRRGVFVVVGGPWVTVKEDYFDGLADAIFIGEAEQTWPRFLDEWQRGEHGYRYEQEERTDMATVPTPRYDLLKMRDYLFGNVQFSRVARFNASSATSSSPSDASRESRPAVISPNSTPCVPWACGERLSSTTTSSATRRPSDPCSRT